MFTAAPRGRTFATRTLPACSSTIFFTMANPSHAIVEFTWKWEPNQLGEAFDASGPLVKSFNTWERGTLIQKYAADFYHANPVRTTVTLAKVGKGWQIAAE